jgi:hypothetical protein
LEHRHGETGKNSFGGGRPQHRTPRGRGSGARAGCGTRARPAGSRTELPAHARPSSRAKGGYILRHQVRASMSSNGVEIDTRLLPDPNAMPKSPPTTEAERGGSNGLTSLNENGSPTSQPTAPSPVPSAKASPLFSENVESGQSDGPAPISDAPAEPSTVPEPPVAPSPGPGPTPASA